MADMAKNQRKKLTVIFLYSLKTAIYSKKLTGAVLIEMLRSIFCRLFFFGIIALWQIFFSIFVYVIVISEYSEYMIYI